ncbi:MAG: ClpXP protease specificity-enhancing factor SspB [Thermodesulfovibrionales bacterium]|nr:ClpXP protease specificity-enhancing factor SspB [Thermodesulfovibrionales bacterium]
MSLEERMNALKETIFFSLMDLAGRVYIIVHYSEDVIIGKRGFTNDEKNNGLVLVFNQKMNFQWDGDVITAKLGFGNTIEKCYIPVNNIVCIFSPDINARFLVDYMPKQKEDKKQKLKQNIKSHSQSDDTKGQSKVITVDFSKKK